MLIIIDLLGDEDEIVGSDDAEGAKKPKGPTREQVEEWLRKQLQPTLQIVS